MKWNLIRLTAALLLLFGCLFEPTLQRRSVFSETVNRETEVLIDPGHGGIDGGAVGVTGVVEKGINLSISEKLSDLLGFFGVSTVLTRTEDRSLSSESDTTIRSQKNADLRKRAELANEMKKAYLLSIHLNAYPDRSCHGAQVFYSVNSKQSESLAKLIQACMVAGLDPENRRVAKPAERGHYLLRNVTCPAVIVECGFLSNYHEEQLLSSGEYQTRIAACIAEGYLKMR